MAELSKQKDDDRHPLAALEKATLQYEQYLELTEVVRTLQEAQQKPQMPTTTWNSPLGLTFNCR